MVVEDTLDQCNVINVSNLLLTAFSIYEGSIKALGNKLQIAPQQQQDGISKEGIKENSPTVILFPNGSEGIIKLFITFDACNPNTGVPWKPIKNTYS